MDKLYDFAMQQTVLSELDGKCHFDYETKTFFRPTTKLTNPVKVDTNEYEGSVIFGTEPVEADFNIGNIFHFEKPQPEEWTQQSIENLFHNYMMVKIRPEISSHRINQIINTPGINEMKGDGPRDALKFVRIVTDEFNEQCIPHDCQLLYMSTSLEIEDHEGVIPENNQVKKYDIIRIPDRYMNGVKVMIINKLSVFQGLDVHTGETEDGIFFDINSATKVLHPESIFIMR